MISYKYQNYFFDFFGTIMFRYCSPDDVKRIWSNIVSRKILFEIDASDLYNIRISCEKACLNKIGEYQYKVLISRIYSYLKCSYDINYEFQEFYDICLSIELDTEFKNQIPNNEMVDIVRNLKKQGKRVYIVSDFYLGKRYIHEFLKDKNIDDLFDDIFVSCECDANKATMGLYDFVINQTEIENKNTVLMIGDNYRSDYINAKRSGIASYYLGENKRYGKQIKIDSLDCSQITDPIYSDYAYFLFLFNERLYMNLMKNNFKDVYFLSREGEFLKKLFDNYCQLINEKYDMPIINSHYLYVSRQATYCPTLNVDINKETFDKLFSEYPDLCLDTFCSNIGFDEKDIELLKSKLDLDFRKSIKSLRQSKEFNSLVQNGLFEKMYRNTVTLQKRLFKDYLNQNGIIDDCIIAVVDVGWKGSIQDNIFNVFENLSIYGYYCGLKNQAIVSENNKKFGLMFSEIPFKTNDYDLWSFDSNFLERLLSASHPSTKKYICELDEVCPVFNKFGSEKNNYEMVKDIQESLLKKHSCIVDKVFGSPFFNKEIYCFLKTKHINNCSKINANHIKLQYNLLNGQMENFGYQTTANEHIASVLSFNTIIQKLKKNIKLLNDDLKIAHIVCLKGNCFVPVLFYKNAMRKIKKRINRN